MPSKFITHGIVVNLFRIGLCYIVELDEMLLVQKWGVDVLRQYYGKSYTKMFTFFRKQFINPLDYYHCVFLLLFTVPFVIDVLIDISTHAF